MPITVPEIDGRRYQDILDEALSRIPAHTPEWTNLNENDPGIALLELFAFMTESLLYRANRIPERNELAFLRLLGLPLLPGVPASGLVVFSNDRGLDVATLTRGIEVRAGSLGYRTNRGLDV